MEGYRPSLTSPLVTGGASTPLRRSAHATEKSVSTRAGTGADGNNHLPDLVDRIPTGDRSEFRCLYGFLPRGSGGRL